MGSATATLVVDPTADTVVEADETVIVSLTSGSDYTLGTPSTATGTITNDDLPVISLAVSPTAVSEDGTANLIYTFTRSGPTTSALNVNYTASGTATIGTDYTGISSTPSSVTFAVGSATATLVVDPTADAEVEADETVIVSLASGSDYTLGTESSVGALITNDDLPKIRGNSIYTIVSGPTWATAEANSVKLGGHLVTINDASENQWIIEKYRQTGLSLSPDLRGARNIFIGLTRADGTGSKFQNAAGKWDGWISGESPAYRPDYWGIGEGMDPDGYFSALVWGDGHWNDFPEWQHQGIGLAETTFIRRGDSAYLIVQGPTWEEAESNAVKLGGHLVTINDASENAWIHKTFVINNGFQNTTLYLTGFTDKDVEGQWEWVSGESSSYTSWEEGEPNNNGNEDYMHLGWYRDGKWNDIYEFWGGSNYTKGIAEINLAPNNKPTGIPTLSGTIKAGQTIGIDKSPIQDTDNFTGWTPTYNFSYEVSNDNGTTWNQLTSTDATDNNSTYTLTTADVGKQVRGLVSYLDGYGTTEAVFTAATAVIQQATPDYTLNNTLIVTGTGAGTIDGIPFTNTPSIDLGLGIDTGPWMRVPAPLRLLRWPVARAPIPFTATALTTPSPSRASTRAALMPSPSPVLKMSISLAVMTRSTFRPVASSPASLMAAPAPTL